MKHMCGACGSVFDDTRHYTEYTREGELIDEWDGCPYCASSFIFDAYKCDICGEWSGDGYRIKKSGDFICSHCVKPVGVDDV